MQVSRLLKQTLARLRTGQQIAMGAPVQ